MSVHNVKHLVTHGCVPGIALPTLMLHLLKTQRAHLGGRSTWLDRRSWTSGTPNTGTAVSVALGAGPIRAPLSVGGCVLARLLHEAGLHGRHRLHEMHPLVEQHQLPIAPLRAPCGRNRCSRCACDRRPPGPASHGGRDPRGSADRRSRVSSDGSSSSNRLANISTFRPTLPQVMTTASVMDFTHSAMV